MKEVKVVVSTTRESLGLDECFAALTTQLTHAIDALDDIKSLKPARKELKRYRTAIGAIQRQVQLYEKDRKYRA